MLSILGLVELPFTLPAAHSIWAQTGRSIAVHTRPKSKALEDNDPQHPRMTRLQRALHPLRISRSLQSLRCPGTPRNPTRVRRLFAEQG